MIIGMKHIIFIVKGFIFFLFSITIVGLNAQQTVSPTAGESSGTGGTVSYTIGQTFYQSYDDSTGKITEGVQQPFEIYVITDIGSVLSASIHLKVFPNPTTDQLLLEVDEKHVSELYYLLVSERGETIEKGKITKSNTTFRLAARPKGMYLLTIIKSDKKQKVFKIIKN